MQRLIVSIVIGGGLLSACGNSTDASLPYAVNETTVIGALTLDKPTEPHVVTTPNGDECLTLNDKCVTPQKECGDDNGKVDLLLDDKGDKVDAICYPTGGVAVEKAEGDLSHVGNNVVLVLDDADDDVDVAGNVTIDGNNVTLYGHGPDRSLIGGDLRIDKNNALVRSLRVLGDVAIVKNDPSIVDCVIEGNLTIVGNNVSVALCEVWGKVTITGNNVILVGNHFASAPEISGSAVCNGNRAFHDDNEDDKIGDDELGDVVDCGTKQVEKS